MAPRIVVLYNIGKTMVILEYIIHLYYKKHKVMLSWSRNKLSLESNQLHGLNDRTVFIMLYKILSN